MQKKKSNKESKVSKFDTNEFSDMLFDTIANDIGMDHPAMDQSLVQMASSAMTNAIALSKIVIENRVRNAESMIDEDIYKIYRQSFTTIIKTASVTED
jgi:hypothetical protein